jgi:DNA-binding transcriptional MerR regulator
MDGGAVTKTASEKLYYKIGEIAKVLNINTSVLRFWETQFQSLSPCKTKTGQRIYSLRDFEQIKEIYNLLYVQKLTIAGAKSRLSLNKKGKNGAESGSAELVQILCHELKELRKLLV